MRGIADDITAAAAQSVVFGVTCEKADLARARPPYEQMSLLLLRTLLALRESEVEPQINTDEEGMFVDRYPRCAFDVTLDRVAAKDGSR